MQLAGWQCGVNDLFVVQLFQLIGGGGEANEAQNERNGG